METWVSAGESGTWSSVDCAAQRGYVCQTYKGVKR